MMSQQQTRQRKWRNFLLDWRFQLKYTGAVVLVTVAVAGVLGYFAYQYSQGQTRLLSAQMAGSPDLSADAMQEIQRYAEEEDTKVLCRIVLGVAILAITLGLTGIIVTHRVVGPVYRMQKLFEEVAAGKLEVSARLRKGDELQELFSSFTTMIDALRARCDTQKVALLALADDLEKRPDTAHYSRSLRELAALVHASTN